MWEETMNFLKKSFWFLVCSFIIIMVIKITSDISEWENEPDKKPIPAAQTLETVVHDTVEITKIIHDTVNISIDGTDVIKIDTMIIDNKKPDEKFSKKKFLVGYPILEPSNNGVRLVGYGPTFEDIENYSIGCEGKIYNLQQKPGLIYCSGNWIIKLKEGNHEI